MNNILLIAIVYIVKTLQKDVVLIKGISGCPPNRICEINGLDDVIGSADNLPYLMSILQNNCVEAAAIGGWNDHASYDLVLRSNGALAPYDRATNTSNYAMCIERGRGCSRGNNGFTPRRHHQSQPQIMPCPPMPCPPMPCPPMPCPPMPCPPMPCPPMPCPPMPCPPMPCPPMPCPPMPCPPMPCPPMPISYNPLPLRPIRRHREKEECTFPSIKCDESSSSSSSSSCSRDYNKCDESSSESSCSDRRIEKCPKYVKQKRTYYKNCNRSRKCEDRVNAAIENIKIVKTFIFSPHDLKNRRCVKFREITDKASNVYKWVELKPIFDGKKITKDGYPALLRFPCFLYELRKYISCKYEYPNPCLYLDCHGKLYVRIRETLYSVNFRRHVKFTQKSAFKHIKLCPVKGRKLDCLIQSGLAGVIFEDRQRDCY